MKDKKRNKFKKFILLMAVLFIVVILLVYLKLVRKEFFDSINGTLKNTISNTDVINKIEDFLLNDTDDSADIQEKDNIAENVSNTVENKTAKNIEIDTEISEKINIDNTKLNIVFFDVGQADSTLIMCNGKTMLIDAGNSRDGKKLVKGIQSLGINKIDYVIGTHAHEDHIGGMNYIIKSFEIGEYYMPHTKKLDFSYFKYLTDALSNKNLNISEPVIGKKFDMGTATSEIMSVDNNEPEEVNDTSIVMELSYGELKYLFMADAETMVENRRKWDDIDLLKVGHHGSNSSSSEEFLNQVLPEISVISVGKDNEYGYPKKKVLNRLNKIGSNVYRTDIDGTIQIVSDGIKNDVVKIDLSFDGN